MGPVAVVKKSEWEKIPFILRVIFFPFGFTENEKKIIPIFTDKFESTHAVLLGKRATNYLELTKGFIPGTKASWG